MARAPEEEVAFGFEDAIASGLDGFQGTIPTKFFPTPTSETSPSSEKQATQYLAGIIGASLSQLQSTATTTWSPHAAELVEITLRSLVRWASPTPEDRKAREGVIARLSGLAESGIRFCRGLYISAYGSFTSGLYTPHGDLDLSIEGVAIMRDDCTGDTWPVPVENLQRKEREKFLHALAGRLGARGANKLVRITHARVPIIKFVDHITGVEVDVAIDSIGAQFKSVAVGIIASMDWRVGALVRLIKLWARHHDLNDSSTGTFNSFALTLLVIFHCQTRSPAILPPLAELFGSSDSCGVDGDGEEDNEEERPMHEHRRPDLTRLRDMQHEVNFRAAARTLDQSGKESKNQETLLELISSFFSMFQGLMEGWNGPDEALSRVLCRVRVDTWHGCLKYRPWTDKKDGAYHCSIEDPLDSTDNVGRTIRDSGTIDRIGKCLDQAVKICSETMTVDNFEQGLEQLFGSEVLEAAYFNDQRLIERRELKDITEGVLPTELWVPESLKGYVSRSQPFVEPEINGPRRGTRLAEGGGGGSQLRPNIFSPGAVLEFPKLTLNGRNPFISNTTGAGTGGLLQDGLTPMDLDLEEEDDDQQENNAMETLENSGLSGSIYWDGLHVLIKQTNAVLATEAAAEAVREAEKQAHRAVRREAKQLKEKARKELKKSKNDGVAEKKTVAEVPRNGEGRAAALAAREKPQAEGQPTAPTSERSGKRPNRRERRRHGGGRGGKINNTGKSGDGTNDASKQNGGDNGTRQPRPAVIVVPRPPPPPGL
ncbi:putative Protein HESO1 [Nannochloris sp. 'desiccata']|nr:putative Protein HESO1 [Chlorella desiccata (nom. nud.)]